MRWGFDARTEHMTILMDNSSPAKTAAKIVDIKSKGKDKEQIRPHVKASLDDINWVRSQSPCVQQLWLDCVAVEQFGGQERELKTSLSRNAFSKAKRALQDKGLFDFEEIYERANSGRACLVGWKVENLHGYYKKKYWELDAQEMTVESQPVNPDGQPVTAECHEKTPDGQTVCKVEAETTDITEFQKPQPRLNKLSTPPQPTTKVVEEGDCITQETQPPLGGAATNGVLHEKEKYGVDQTCSSELEVKIEVVACEPEAPSLDKCSGGGDDLSTNSQLDIPNGCLPADEVGHTEQVAAICKLALNHYCRVNECDRDELMKFNLGQLEIVFKTFERDVTRRSSTTTAERFHFALKLGRYSRGASNPWRRCGTDAVRL